MKTQLLKKGTLIILYTEVCIIFWVFLDDRQELTNQSRRSLFDVTDLSLISTHYISLKKGSWLEVLKT
ncbi:hypothetical protein Q8A67_001303 [Cirrhinus molitorella]|uniref:Uncharacterized protein n=1 Tax=Cirrhinus molitorella TaxID=172907 RepID=A0AA88TZJ8_9TELE|nr:hypothetical protein Q8A67_001303 [Cirrhinus molitorella]